MKKVYALLILLLSISPGLVSQAGKIADPAAEKILDNLKSKYDAFESVEVNFSLIIDVPEEDELLQEGRIIQQNDQYLVDLPDQALYSNGKVLWVHLKNNEEVQINDLEEEDATDLLSPKDLLNMYNSDEFDYLHAGQSKEKGINYDQIEFKPLDEFSDYSKIRMYVDTKENQLEKVIVFAKDGSRYTMTIKNMLSNKKYPNDVFTFDISKYPKIHVEDLRID